MDTLGLLFNICKDFLQNPFFPSKNPHAKHIQATHLKRNCLLEISCSLHVSAFIKYGLTEKTKWKSISCNSELWLQCNGFIMSRMINIPNCRLCFSSSSPTGAETELSDTGRSAQPYCRARNSQEVNSIPCPERLPCSLRKMTHFLCLSTPSLHLGEQMQRRTMRPCSATATGHQNIFTVLRIYAII